jgi:hypothetical protein
LVSFAVLTKLNDKFAVVHVHANNYKPLLAIGNLLFPEVLEVTMPAGRNTASPIVTRCSPARSTAPIGRLRRITESANSSTKRPRWRVPSPPVATRFARAD